MHALNVHPGMFGARKAMCDCLFSFILNGPYVSIVVAAI